MKGWVLFRVLGALLLVLGVVLTLGGCRVWDNPADPDGVNYQGYHTVESVDDVEAHTPTDGGSLVFQRFIISEARGAEAYHLQIASSVDFGNTLYDGNSHAANIMLTDAPLSLNTVYYWRGRAKQGGQWGKWTDGWKFTMTTISGLNPADGSSTTDTTPTFRWNAVLGAAGYELRIADSPAGLNSAPLISETDPSHTPASALTNLQTHYWQVRAKDGDGQFGFWSNVHNLEVEWGAVSGLNPADGSTTEDTTPTLSWDAVPGAAGYEVRIADSLAGLNSAPSASETDPSHTPASALTNLQTHYWQVRAKDGDGQSGAWSGVASIQVVVYSIGDTGPAGGIVFYDKGSYSDGWRYLEAAPSDQGDVGWGEYGTTVGGTSTAIGSGKSNTEKIVNKLGSGNYAARLCYDFELGGYDDWFLPSKDELNELYKQKDTVGGFASYSYWSSSEFSSSDAWGQYFSDGSQYGSGGKYGGGYVRAVRAF